MIITDDKGNVYEVEFLETQTGTIVATDVIDIELFDKYHPPLNMPCVPEVVSNEVDWPLW